MTKIFQLLICFAFFFLGLNLFVPLFPSSFFVDTFTVMTWGYFWGSCTGGPLFARIFNLGDLKKIGSGNIGTTNVLRTGNKTAAILTLLFDALKAYIAIKTLHFIIPEYQDTPSLPYFAAFGAFIGHLFPLFSSFSGGKGIATLAGISFTLAWPLGLLVLGLWITTALLTRYSSLAGIVAVLGGIPLCYLLNEPYLMYFFTAVAPLVLFRHKDNIHRLIEGRETRIGNIKKSSSKDTDRS